MSRLPTACPACATSLEVTRMACPGCAMSLEGHFALPALLRLPPDDLALVLDFVLCAGSFKELGQRRQLSYPTVRARFDDVLARLAPPDGDGDRRRRAVLDALAKGQISVKQAAKQLAEIEP